MNRLVLNPAWPKSWQESHAYDEMELFGARACLGYSYAYQVRRGHTLELVRHAASAPARVLDVAAAQGNFSLALAESGYEITWNDLREELEGYVRLKYQTGLLHFAPGNVFDLRCEPFDVVLITEVIEHVAHPDEFLRKVAELVKPGGHIVMSTPNGAYFHNQLPKFSDCPDPAQFESIQFKPNSDGHIFLLHPDEVAPLAAQAGLRVEEMRVFTTPLTNGHFKTETLLQVLPRSAILAAEHAVGSLPERLKRSLSIGLAALLRKM